MNTVNCSDRPVEIVVLVLDFIFYSECFSVNPVFDLAVFPVAPKILEALQIAETYMEKTENFSGKVRDLS